MKTRARIVIGQIAKTATVAIALVASTVPGSAIDLQPSRDIGTILLHRDTQTRINRRLDFQREQRSFRQNDRDVVNRMQIDRNDDAQSGRDVRVMQPARCRSAVYPSRYRSGLPLD